MHAIDIPKTGSLYLNDFQERSDMTTKDMKAEIQRKLDEVPEAILEEVLEYLRGFQAKTPEEQKRLLGLKRILHEKRDLLLRLAR
ncbi:MAG TPA: hypothetical protein VGE21_06895 [Flavobacteriales bacterium]